MILGWPELRFDLIVTDFELEGYEEGWGSKVIYFQGDTES